MSKPLKLVDTRSVGGGIVRELRKAIKGIDAGEIVSVAVVYVRRDNTFERYFDCESALRTLGVIEVLKDDIKAKIK